MTLKWTKSALVSKRMTLDADRDISPKSISSDDINKRLAQLQNLIDDGAGIDDKSDAMTLGEIKGSKLDFGSPEKVAGVALSSATLKSPRLMTS